MKLIVVSLAVLLCTTTAFAQDNNNGKADSADKVGDGAVLTKKNQVVLALVDGNIVCVAGGQAAAPEGSSGVVIQVKGAS